MPKINSSAGIILAFVICILLVYALIEINRPSVNSKLQLAAVTSSETPTISVTSTSGGDSVVVGTSVTVTANFFDTVNIAGVQFKVDNRNIGTEDTSAPYSATWDTAGETIGTHTLSAVVRDTAGLTSTAASISATVTGTTNAPTYGNILMLGDSITQGYAYNQTYRYPLWKKLIDETATFDFVGSMDSNVDDTYSRVWLFPDYKSKAFDRNHEGHWGWSTDNILMGIAPSPGLSTWLQGYTPDIVVIHLGANDAAQNFPVSKTKTNLGTIIDLVRADNPRVKILLDLMIPCGFCGTGGIEPINAMIPGLAAEKTTAQSPILVVDQHTGFDLYDPGNDTYDGIHPSATGEEKMATKLIAGLRALSALSSVTQGTVTPSANGTRGTSVTDNSGVVWTIDANNNVLRNGIPFNSGWGSELLWWNGVVYHKGVGTLHWYSWSGTTWTDHGLADPQTGVTPSANATLGTSITDSQGAVWTLDANNNVLRNGTVFQPSWGDLLFYYTGTVYHRGVGTREWYSWNGSTWVSGGKNLPTSASTKFTSTVSRVQTTAQVNARAAPSLSGTVTEVKPIGAQGLVTLGPLSADGNVWWHIDYDTGGDGWTT